MSVHLLLLLYRQVVADNVWSHLTCLVLALLLVLVIYAFLLLSSIITSCGIPSA